LMSSVQKILVFVLSAFSLGLIIHTLFISDAWDRRQNLHQDLDALVEQNQAAEDEIKSLRSQIDAVRRRPEVQERIVRDELGYIRPGEIIVELDGESTGKD